MNYRKNAIDNTFTLNYYYKRYLFDFFFKDFSLKIFTYWKFYNILNNT